MSRGPLSGNHSVGDKTLENTEPEGQVLVKCDWTFKYTHLGVREIGKRTERGRTWTACPTKTCGPQPPRQSVSAAQR